MEVQTCGKPIDSLLEKVLCMNILSSDYFKELYRLKTYHEVIDEIYNQVDHVEPWMTGNCRGPSTAFCLLYKFFTMKLTVKQMHGLLKHPDSPYIRAIGFLYLRYVADPKTLWGWYEPYVKDEEEFSPGSNGRMTTMGVYVRDLLLGQYYFDTLFPRIPVPVMRQITSNLERLNLPTRHAGVTGEANRHGSDETARRPPSVKAALSVSFGQRAPHRASTRDASPVRRTLPRDRNDEGDIPRTANGGRYREGDRDKELEKDNERERGRNSRDRERERERSRDRDRERYRDRSRERDRDRERSRERDRDRERDRYRESRDRDLERERSRDRDRGRERSKDRDHGRDRSKDYEREYERERNRDYDRERSRDRDHERRSKERARDRASSKEFDHHRDGRDDNRSFREKDSRYYERDSYRSESQSPRKRQRSESPQHEPSPKKEKTSLLNLAKLRDIYGDSSTKNDDAITTQKRDSNSEDVIRLGATTWR
eukprot:TRINITY_DN2697_c0_g1_i2.p1 TRINITY_DN2697_c0_g1~~TRINITY_DN2697_c0_g1_i2.p1  ORF type:complete len:485 (-),score=113.76 TRINITY_DN2697_c0_g1_i2:354-1808(-)